DEDPCDRSGEDRQVRGELEDAVGERELVVLENLRKDPVLRRAEERAVRRHREERGEKQGKALGREAPGGERHGEDLGKLRREKHPVLRESIREVTGDRRKEQEGNGKKRRGEAR